MRLVGALAAVCALTALTAVACSPGVAAATSPEAFCKKQTLHDYRKPMKWLPTQHASEFGRLGFGPRGVTVSGLEENEELMAEGGQVRIGIYYPSEIERNDWVATVKLASVDRDGQVIHLRSSQQREIGTESAPISQSFVFHLPPKPQIYRAQMTIRDVSGDLLGRFGKYIRVLAGDHETALVLSAPAYHLGETVLARIENFGTLAIPYSPGYVIERFDGTAWSPAPETPRGFIQPGWGVEAGKTSFTCEAFTIPSTMPPGHYRMFKQIWRAWDARQTSVEPRFVFAPEFDIAP